MTKEKLNAIIKNLKEVKNVVDKYCDERNCSNCMFREDKDEYCKGVKLDDSIDMLVKEREVKIIKEMVNDVIRKAKENARKS